MICISPKLSARNIKEIFKHTLSWGSTSSSCKTKKQTLFSLKYTSFSLFYMRQDRYMCNVHKKMNNIDLEKWSHIFTFQSGVGFKLCRSFSISQNKMVKTKTQCNFHMLLLSLVDRNPSISWQSLISNSNWKLTATQNDERTKWNQHNVIN